MTAIIDTGCANLASVRMACERLGASVVVSADPATLLSAERIILPGVGSAPAAMDLLRERDLLQLLPRITQPLLGICLGMQLLGAFSAEGNTAMAGLLPVSCEQLDSQGLPLPHMGWNAIEPTDHPLFAGIRSGDYVYFVHGYGIAAGPLTLASCTYGQTFSAAIGQGQIMGVQFHPELSGPVGARILKNFLEYPA